MEQDQNTHVLWQIRARAVSAVYLASPGLLRAWGRHWQGRWDEQQCWLSLSSTVWVSWVLKHSTLLWNQCGLFGFKGQFHCTAWK